MQGNRMWMLGVVAALIGSPVLADLEMGDDAPPVAITKWVQGDPVELAAVKGQKVVILEFWATWCGPCIRSMPHLTEIQKKYADQGLRIIGVTKPDPNNPLEKVEQFVKDNQDKMAYTVAFDGDAATNDAYMKAAGQNGIPTSFIIDRAGKVAWIGHPMDMDKPLAAVLADKHDIGLFKLNGMLEKRFAQKRSAQAWDDSIRTLEALSVLNPEDPGPWRERVTLYAGQLASPEKALAAAETAVRLGADSADELNMLASTIRYGRPTEPLQAIAEKAAKRAIELKPEDAAMRLTAIDVYAAAGKADDAVKAARESLDLIVKKDPAQLSSLVRTLTAPPMQGRGLDVAKKASEQALTAGWDNATTMSVLAFSLRAIQGSEEFKPLALKAARRAVELKPEEGRGYLTLIDTLLAVDQGAEALQVAEKNSEMLLKQDAMILGSLARSLSSPKLAGKGSAMALKTLDAALAAQPDDVMLVETKFRVQATSLKDRTAALATGEYFLEKASNNQGTLNSFAWAVLTEDGLKGQFNELALRAALKCHEVSNGLNWAYLDTLALAKFETGSKQEAVELERKSLDLAKKAGITSIADLEAALKRFEEGAKTADRM